MVGQTLVEQGAPMTERTNTIGSINVARGVFEHDLLADEPFAEREAWMWLITEAQ